MSTLIRRLQSFIGELKRRHVTQVAVAYGIIAFGVMQVADIFFPALKLPDWTITVLAALLIMGLPISVCLAWAFDITPAGLRATDEVKLRSGPTRLATASLLILCVAVGGGFFAVRLSTANHSVNAIAVLPFENMSGDPDNEYFSDGITEDVLTQLSKFNDLKVISRTSVMQYKKAPKPMREIANELRVGAILEGSVRRVGNNVRITAQLIDASNDKHLWAESYDRNINDIFEVQSEIATEIAEALRNKLTPETRANLERLARQAADPHAYEEYLRGLHHAAAGRRTESNAHLERAIEINPRYAPAHAALARNYYFMGFVGGHAPQVIAPKLRDAARQALELDDGLADAHATYGLYLMHFAHDLKAAESSFERALDIAPANAQVRHDYAHYLLVAGQPAQSAAESVRASELDPKNAMLQACAGWHRFADGHYQAAIDGAGKALMMNPTMMWPRVILGWGQQQSGHADEALVALRKAVVDSKERPFARAALAHALAVNGHRDEALRIVQELKAAPAATYVSAYDVAAVYAGIGDADQAFAWLDKAHAERSTFLIFIGWDPRFNGLKKDTRYEALARRLRLPAA